MDVGTIVRLRSGGPKMVVAENGSTKLVCHWFSKTRKLRTGMFPEDSLKPVRKKLKKAKTEKIETLPKVTQERQAQPQERPATSATP